MSISKITLFTALVVVAIAVISLPSVDAGKKGGHKIIVTSGSKKKCGCHKQTIPVPVPVPVPVHIPHHQVHQEHGHGHGYGGGGFAERMAFGWRKRRSLVDAIKSAATSTRQVNTAEKK